MRGYAHCACVAYVVVYIVGYLVQAYESELPTVRIYSEKGAQA